MDLIKYIGLPYKEYGRDFNGCDCYGLIYLFYKHELGIELPTYSALYNHNNSDSIKDIISREKTKWIKVDKPKKFDGILFNISGMYNHIGIFLDNNLFLHSAKIRGESCIERITHPFWNTRIEGFYRYGNNNQ